MFLARLSIIIAEKFLKADLNYSQFSSGNGSILYCQYQVSRLLLFRVAS